MVEITLESVWSEVLERLQLLLSRPTFEAWIKTATAEQLDDKCLTIRTPHPFARNWIQKYYIRTITDVVQEVVGRPVEIHIAIAQGDEAMIDNPEMFWPRPNFDNDFVIEPPSAPRQRHQCGKSQRTEF